MPVFSQGENTPVGAGNAASDASRPGRVDRAPTGAPESSVPPPASTTGPSLHSPPHPSPRPPPHRPLSPTLVSAFSPSSHPLPRPAHPHPQPTMPKTRSRSISGSDTDTASPRVRARSGRSRDRSLSVTPTRTQSTNGTADSLPASGSRSPRSQQESWPETSAPASYPAPRKQNVACDACRNRKVKCVRNPGMDKCQHCIGKNFPCTNLIQQATSERKRQQGGVRRNIRPLSGEQNMAIPGSSIHPPSESPRGISTLATGLPSAPPSRNSIVGFLSYVFAPPREDSYPSEDWGVMGTKLESETFRTEFALDLIDVYFQICHTRLPVLDPQNFRMRFKYSLPQAPLPPGLPARDFEPLPLSLVAVVLAWGAKFSEHPIIVHDRQSNKDKSSALARSLVRKAREISEMDRVFRIATPENVLICLLLEPLQSQMVSDPDGFHGFWLNSGIRHMLELRVNYRVGAIPTTDSQGASIVMAWWMACLADGFSSAYFRSKPALDDDDYNIQALSNNTFLASSETLGIGTPSEFVTWYTALHILACEVRRMSRILWTPVIAEEGIPAKVVQDLLTRLNRWRDGYLNAVGVPSNFEADWNFVAAVSACSSDASFHVMFIILHQAVEDFGIRDLQRGADSSGMNADIKSLQATLAGEAVHSALRIAALTGVLTTNGYLRLDPNVLHYSTYAAGLLLARQGRPEAVNCITGLRQYAFAYEEAHIQADELEAVLAAVNRERTQRGHGDERHSHVSAASAYSRMEQTPFAAGLPAVSVHHPAHGPLMTYGGSEVANPPYGMYEAVGGMPAEQPPQNGSHYHNFSSRR